MPGANSRKLSLHRLQRPCITIHVEVRLDAFPLRQVVEATDRVGVFVREKNRWQTSNREVSNTK